jgi:hypothetical protein
MSDKFPIELGSELPKSKIHQLLGGSDQHAMTSCMNKTSFLLFHDPKKGKKYGYDTWEGQNADGSFSYTGQGVLGDQKMTRSNLGLVKASEKGHPIHFFKRPEIRKLRGTNNPYTYAGEVILGSPPFRTESALDSGKNLRKVFVFNLIPVGLNLLQESPDSKIGIETSAWIAPSTQSSFNVQPQKIPISIEYDEFKLQNRFLNYIKSIDEIALQKTIKISNQKGSLRPDFYLERSKIVIEAKTNSTREYVRLAIGQVLDYQNLLLNEDEQVAPAILLPQLPAKDLVELCSRLGIIIITENLDGGFTFKHPEV